MSLWTNLWQASIPKNAGDVAAKKSNEQNAVKVGTREILTGAINHSRGVLHGSYKKSLPWGVPREIFCMAKMRFQRNRNDFLKVSFTLCNLRAYGVLFCNWK
jgi:hypothetical protein